MAQPPATQLLTALDSPVGAAPPLPLPGGGIYTGRRGVPNGGHLVLSKEIDTVLPLHLVRSQMGVLYSAEGR